MDPNNSVIKRLWCSTINIFFLFFLWRNQKNVHDGNFFPFFYKDNFIFAFLHIVLSCSSSLILVVIVFQLMTVWCFMAQSLSLLSFLHLCMTKLEAQVGQIWLTCIRLIMICYIVPWWPSWLSDQIAFSNPKSDVC